MRAALLSCAFASLAAAVPTISVKGSKFFNSDGDQFFVKGIAYQLVPDDPLIDNTQCGLDAALMKDIGTNSIRVYHVDASADHTDCMKTFADAGIYIWLDLDTFDTQIEQTSPHWNESQRDAFGAVMDEFHQYDNLAGFFVGNEVLTHLNGSHAGPYVKAAARDMKAYRDSKKYRNIPIGYSAADIATLRPMLQNYMACGSNASEALDFFSLNAYSWCGEATFQTSGYKDLVKNVTAVNYNIPIFLSETGCREPRPRTFEDQAVLFGEDMTPHWSGSIVYEWIEEANNYGLIKYGDKVAPDSPSAPPDGFPRSGTPTPINPDFSNLSNQWKTLTPSGVKEADYHPTLTPPPCPDFTPTFWEVSANAPLPTLGQTFSRDQDSSTGGQPAPTGGPGQGTPTPSSTQGAAPGNPAWEVQSMGLGLMAVLAGFLIWM
ncbi:Glucanosyltransferase-domain-containing protein [Massariosphaeria phaeospora]|uniref:1,3-beta-glucanosyltransferase n=1 Tax=Massariosphaeria phaeospora TaxID=100035 RepID=A0A7C8MAX3_9PLEO|nr:Glucanosyltransferase-domain-containing protein [Massariosphaeria phaeospora]